MNIKKLADYVWVLPVLLVLTTLILFPLIQTLIISFFHQSVGGAQRFVGFDNYAGIFKSGAFFGALGRTVTFTVPAILLKLVIGMSVALILTNPFKGRNLLRTWLFIPWSIPYFAAGILAIWIFRMNGAMNLIFSKLGLDPVYWLGPKLAMASVIAVNTWKGFPFFMVGLLAGLQVIPTERYEASAIDGANGFQQFLHVTVPGVKNVLLIITVLSTIWTFSQFESIFVITMGGPGRATETLSIAVYKRAFGQYNFSGASAMAVMALPFFMFLIYWLVRLTQRGEE